MSIDIDKLSSSSRLYFKNEAYEAVQSKLESVISWIKDIQTIDTDGIEPMINPMYLDNGIFSDKVVKNCIIKDELFANSANHDEEYFTVPKVIE